MKEKKARNNSNEANSDTATFHSSKFYRRSVKIQIRSTFMHVRISNFGAQIEWVHHSYQNESVFEQRRSIKAPAGYRWQGVAQPRIDLG